MFIEIKCLNVRLKSTLSIHLKLMKTFNLFKNTCMCLSHDRKNPTIYNVYKYSTHIYPQYVYNII